MNRRKSIRLIIPGLALALILLSSSGNSGSAKEPGLIPWPAQVSWKSGSFKLEEETIIAISPDTSPELKSSAGIFIGFLKSGSGLELKISRPDQARNTILLELKPDPELEKFGPEAYLLEIAENRIKISAPEPAGIFNGAMTLLQIFSSAADSRTAPGLKIIDYPRFSHRGLLLDPARHFLSVELVKQVLDAMAQIKLNVLHFHLVDDQGWRMESKIYPELHRVGGKGGYYTQDQLKDLVAYARSRYITIEPEIEMPGHSSALLAAYPELSCSGEKVAVSNIWGIHRNALCPGKEGVYVFLDQLLKEVAGIFPSYYIHTGSDEVMAQDWQDFPANRDLEKTLAEKGNMGLQCYFINKVNRTFLAIDRRMIVWDEMADCLPEGAMAQAWRSTKSVQPVTASGHGVVVSPVDPWYLDYPDWPWKLKKVYRFEPVPEGLSAEQEKLIKGGQGNLWGENAPEPKIMAKLFPRLLAVSEVLWSPKASRDWQSFQAREAKVRKTFEKQGVHFILLPFLIPGID